MIVLGIDPGIRNLGWCLMMDGTRMLVGLDDLFPDGNVSMGAAFTATMRWIDDHRDLIDVADKVVIELQFVDEKRVLSTCLLTVMTAIRAVCHPKCVVVHASVIKAAYRIARKSNDANKQAAVECVARLDPDILRVFSGDYNIQSLTNKKDKCVVHHICDAFLLAHWIFHKGMPVTFSEASVPDIECPDARVPNLPNRRRRRPTSRTTRPPPKKRSRNSRPAKAVPV